jgi:MscS family membrane protein
VMPSLGFRLTFRLTYARVAVIAMLMIVSALIWRLVSAAFQQARVGALRRGRSEARSLILLGERVAKVVIVLIAVFGLLASLGVDVTTALAGLGIAGVALALGAQKSVENLLGGIFLIADRVLAVGDYCRIADREGWVEDITLRSVQLRTLQQTLLSVPAGVLAQGNLENYSTRSKILLQSLLKLRYGTTSDQIQAVLSGVRRALAANSQMEQDTARVRLTAFGDLAIEIEVFAYILTPDFSAYLAVREALLLQIAGIVESAGSAFAAPMQFTEPVH